MWNQLAILLAFSVGNLAAESTERSGALVSFGELTEVELNGEGLGNQVNTIEADLQNPGGFIIGNYRSVGQIFPNNTLTTLAGQVYESGSQLGVGTKAGFTIVTKTVQINNGDDIIVIDYDSHCTRRLNRQTALVTAFAGRCGGNSEKLDGSVNALEALLPQIIGMVYMEIKNVFYYLLHDASQIVEHDLDTKLLTVKYYQPETLEGAWGMVADSTGDYLFVTHHRGISKISTSTWTRTLVAGQDASVTYQTRSVNGTLLEARFADYISRLTWLIPDQVLLAGEPGSRSLRVINIFDGIVSDLCRGIRSGDAEFRFGGPDTCMVRFPRGIEATDGAIYIGDSSQRNGIQSGHILKLPYYQPICTAMPVDRGSYEPVQERYTHNQTIRYRCEDGYGISTNYSILTCVRAVHPNGTVYGEWDKSVPTCKNFEVDYIRPTSGQNTGGTKVTISGTIPDNVNVILRDNDQLIASVNFTKNSRSLILTMPPKPEGTSENVTIGVVLLTNGIWTEVHAENFAYLPAPVITGISRNGSVARGGLAMDFKGTEISSRLQYALKISGDFPKQSNLVFTSTCAPMPGSVRCFTPNVMKQFYNNSTGNASEYVIVKGDLLSEGVPVTGATDFDFIISSSFPEFENTTFKPPYIYNLTKDDTINLYGQNLDTLIMAADYKVLLMFEEKKPLNCSVTNVNRTSLQCAPPEKQLREYKGLNDPSLTADIEVTVRYLQELVRSVEFIGWEKITSTTNSLPIEARTSKVDLGVSIGVPVAVSILTAIGLIIFFTVRMKRRPPEGNFIEGSGKYEEELTPKKVDFEDQINENLKSMVAKLRIEPTCITFDHKAEPIGKGHFGDVHWGQLRTKENTLKTVAVKTLKANIDIGVEEVEEFLTEATFMLYNQHLNILKTIGVVWNKGDRPQVVLPYMANGDLCSLVRKPDIILTNGDVLHFGVQVANGMEYLTLNRCLHRDLAARNCLVSDKFIVKIADFGMSKDVYTDNYYQENKNGKPKPVKWMAIECLREGKYNSQTEVWSFGVLMWELMTRGSIPYPEVNNDEVYDYLMAGRRLRKPAHTHAAIFSEISKCWEEDAESRPTFTELKETLEKFLAAKDNDEPAEQHSDETSKEFKYSCQRNKTKLIPHDYINSGLFEDSMEYLPTAEHPGDAQYCLTDITYVEEGEGHSKQSEVLPKDYFYVNADGGHLKDCKPSGDKEGYAFL